MVAEGPGSYSGDDVGRDLVRYTWDCGYVVRGVGVVWEDDPVAAGECGLGCRVDAHLRHDAADG